MKINGKLQMAFGPVGKKVMVDNASNTTLIVGGVNPFVVDIQGHDTFDKWGDWVTPQFEIGQEFALTVRSGYFKGTVVEVTHRDDIPGRENLITVEGQWNGAQGGATGGLSGLGLFSITEITSVEGTFGEALSLDEYNERVQGYRSLYYSMAEDPERGLIYNLTPMGELEAKKFLRQVAPGVISKSELVHEFARVGHVSTADSLIEFREFRKWLDLRYAENMQEEILLSNTFVASSVVAPNAPPVNSMELALQSIGV